MKSSTYDVTAVPLFERVANYSRGAERIDICKRMRALHRHYSPTEVGSDGTVPLRVWARTLAGSGSSGPIATLAKAWIARKGIQADVDAGSQ